MNDRLEILAPAGDRERLEAALLFGADAVYLAGKAYGMRSAPANFDEEGLRQAVSLAHKTGRKVYVTVNVLPRNGEMEALPAYLEFLQGCGADGIIAADLGVMRLALRHAPRCALHVSTQTGVVNFETARMLHDLGAARVVLARELSVDEIAEIRAKTPPELELEAFVHGAMCMAYSGRCLLSAYLTGRDANRGGCAQPCRWKYRIVEPSRPDRPLTAEEDETGTYLFNADDLCMIDHLPALSRAGVRSLKIEGRAKAAYYVAVITNAYRAAADGWAASGYAADYRPAPWISAEVNKVSHRPYGTGFYFGPPGQNTASGGYIREFEVAAVAEEWAGGLQRFSQRNRFTVGDECSVLEPGRPPFSLTVREMFGPDGEPLTAAPHPTMPVWIPLSRPLVPGSLLRRPVCGGA